MDHLQLGHGGNWCAKFSWIFVELIWFPDLTQGIAAIKEKNPQVEGNDATVGVEAEINWEMYVLY